MNCKFCGAELVEEKPFCPSCGKDNTLEEAPEETLAAEEMAAEETMTEETVTEETIETEAAVEEAPKANSSKVAICITAIVVILALIIALVVSAMSGKEAEATEPTAATDVTLEQTVEYTTPADTLADDVTYLGSYTVSDEDVKVAADTVVATMGGAELTLADLQIYYWTEVFNFLNSYGSSSRSAGQPESALHRPW